MDLALSTLRSPGQCRVAEAGSDDPGPGRSDLQNNRLPHGRKGSLPGKLHVSPVSTFGPLFPCVAPATHVGKMPAEKLLRQRTGCIGLCGGDGRGILNTPFIVHQIAGGIEPNLDLPGLPSHRASGPGPFFFAARKFNAARFGTFPIGYPVVAGDLLLYCGIPLFLSQLFNGSTDQSVVPGKLRVAIGQVQLGEDLMGDRCCLTPGGICIDSQVKPAQRMNIPIEEAEPRDTDDDKGHEAGSDGQI